MTGRNNGPRGTSGRQGFPPKLASDETAFREGSLAGGGRAGRARSVPRRQLVGSDLSRFPGGTCVFPQQTCEPHRTSSCLSPPHIRTLPELLFTRVCLHAHTPRRTRHTHMNTSFREGDLPLQP